MLILGIDPGSYNTGYGIVEVDGGRVVHREHGVIEVSKGLEFSARLQLIGEKIQALMAQWTPHVTVVEKIFLGRNADSAFKLGHVRGVCLLEALRVKSEISEYTPREVKKGITGSGAAEKEQVQMILFSILGIRAAAKVDASDALALAYYHAVQLEVAKRMKKSLRESSL